MISPDKKGHTIFRGGGGVFYDRLPLLAGDFTQNAAREVTLFDTSGVALGPATIFHPFYEEFGAGQKDCSLRIAPWQHALQHHLECGNRSGAAPSCPGAFSYLASKTHNEFTLNPQVLSPTDGLLLLSNLGGSRYHEFEATLRIKPSNKADINISYVNSQARGNLNSMASVYVPYEQPVIHPNLSARSPPTSPTASCMGRLSSERFIVSPVLDWHSGFPYSIFDDLQNYVGPPNSRRFPTFLSLD